MTNYSSGHLAEQVAAEFLVRQGYEVLALNWKRPACEIDIVAKKDETIHLIEVKHRINLAQGGGLDYITPAKLKHMMRAAEIWVQLEGWQGDYCLGAMELQGSEYMVGEFIDCLTT